MNWEEVLGVVDENNSVIGAATKREVYDQKLRHQIVHVFLIHPKTRQIYLQRRSATMSYMPNCWCSSAAGHVGFNEPPKDAAERELAEELGVSTSVSFLGTIPFLLDGHERFLMLYTAQSAGPFNLSEREVSEGKFFSLDEIEELIDHGQFIHPQLPPCFALLLENKNGV